MIFCDPLQFSFTKRVALTSFKELLFLTFISNYGSPENILKVFVLVVYVYNLS